MKLELKINVLDLKGKEGLQKLFSEYLKQINTKQYVFTDREIDLLSVIMVGITDLKEICTLLNIRLSNLKLLIDSLIKKEVINEKLELYNKLQNFSDFINKQTSLQLTMQTIINYDIGQVN